MFTPNGCVMVSFDALDWSRTHLIVDTTVADLGFSRRGEGRAPISQFGAKTYYLARFVPKL